ncbi:hypothetical protein EK904_000887 [Melospiza melodia maxima]|nr:hypothetical protein EK904_000887 [Melospiza melodia maxima]
MLGKGESREAKKNHWCLYEGINNYKKDTVVKFKITIFRKDKSSEYDEEEVDYEESDSDESWTTESAISSEAILSSMCMNGGDEKPFACPVPGCKKRYKNVNGIKYHAKNGHRTQIRVRKPFKCRCGKSYKTAQGLRHHTINFHPPVSAEIIRKMQQ